MKRLLLILLIFSTIPAFAHVLPSPPPVESQCSKSNQSLCKNVCDAIMIPTVIGILTGLGTGWWTSKHVSRIFYKKALLDDCSRLLRRLCPYRKENKRDGDGLDETSWALKIQAEIMRRSFPSEAEEIEKLSTEIGNAKEIDPSNNEKCKERDTLKEEWKRQVAELYC